MDSAAQLQRRVALPLEKEQTDGIT